MFKTMLLVLALSLFIGSTVEQKSANFFHPVFTTKTVEGSNGLLRDSIRQIDKYWVNIRGKALIAIAMIEGEDKMKTKVTPYLPPNVKHKGAFGYSRPWQNKYEDVLDSLPCFPEIFERHNGVELIEWEAREDNAEFPSSDIKYAMGFMTKDGDILDLGGNFDVRLPLDHTGRYYLILNSPRIFSVMTPDLVTLDLKGTFFHDFTASGNNYYKEGGIEIRPGLWAIPGFDIAGAQLNNSGGENQCDLHDRIKMHNETTNTPGYYQGDANYDAIVTKGDDVDIWESYLFQRSKVPYVGGGERGDNTGMLFGNLLASYILKGTSLPINVNDSTFNLIISMQRTVREALRLGGAQFIIEPSDSNIHLENVTLVSSLLDVIHLSTHDNRIRLIVEPRDWGNFQISDQEQQIVTLKIKTNKVHVLNQNLLTWRDTPLNAPVSAVYEVTTGTFGQDTTVEITSPWTHTMEGLLTGVNPTNNTIPDNYSLSQNYPNPFNPATTIEYTLPNSGNVTLSVFDIRGREVMTLVNEQKSAGNHSIVFDGSTLSSGTYFYRIKVNEFVEIKKMMLIK